MPNTTEKIPEGITKFETYEVFKWLKSKKFNDVMKIREQCIKSEHPLVEFSTVLQNWFENNIFPPDGEIPEPFESLLHGVLEEIDWWEIAKVFIRNNED